MVIDTTVINHELKTKTTINNDTAEKLICKLNEEVLELGIEMYDEKYVHLLKQELADVIIVLSQIIQYYNFTQADLENKLMEVTNRYGKPNE